MKTRTQATQIKPIRWSLSQACSEFDIHKETLSKRIKTQGIEPGADGLFATKQICDAVYGDISGERLREVKGRADKLELENARLRGELVSTSDVMTVWENVGVSLRQCVKASHLSDTEKADFLRNIRSLSVRELLAGVQADTPTPTPTQTTEPTKPPANQ